MSVRGFLEPTRRVPVRGDDEWVWHSEELALYHARCEKIHGHVIGVRLPVDPPRYEYRHAVAIETGDPSAPYEIVGNEEAVLICGSIDPLRERIARLAEWVGQVHAYESD